jgi:hypothetical protein
MSRKWKRVLFASGVGVMLALVVLSGGFYITNLGDNSVSQSTQEDSQPARPQPTENQQTPSGSDTGSTEGDMAGWVKGFAGTVDQSRPHFEVENISKDEIVSTYTGSDDAMEANINQISLIYANSIDKEIIGQEASDGTYQPRKGDTAPYRPPDLIIRNPDGDTVATINGRLAKYHAMGTLSEEEYLTSSSA